MDITPDNTPLGWPEILEESEADLAASRVVSSETVHRKFREGVARLDAKAAARQHETSTPLIGYTERALQQIEDLRDHYGNLDRFEVFYAAADIPGRL